MPLTFGRSRAIAFDPYGGRRSRRRFPRWLLLLLLGVVFGAAGVLYAQERYLPPRLSVDASARLQADYRHAETERLRLVGELGDTRKQLDAALADSKRLADSLAADRGSVERLRDDLAAIVDALPPDPRNGVVAVRAARFTARRGTLDYDVVLTRGGAGDKSMPAVMRLIVAGESARHAETSASSKPIALSIGGHEIVRGSLPLPDGFTPRQTTVQVLDRADGKLLGVRVMLVRG